MLQRWNCWKNNFKFEPGLLMFIFNLFPENENFFAIHDTDPKFNFRWIPVEIFPG